MDILDDKKKTAEGLPDMIRKMFYVNVIGIILFCVLGWIVQEELTGETLEIGCSKCGVFRKIS